MSILNLTQHAATKEQVEDGVIDLEGEELAELKRLLTFNTLLSLDEIRDRAILLMRCHGKARTF